MRKSRFDEQFKRIIKSPEEIGLIRKASDVSNSCVNLIQEKLAKSDITEKMLADAVDSKIRENNCDLSFPTIVCCGKRSRFVHPIPTTKKISGIGYIDYGAKYEKYCSDMTVPFIKGCVSDEEKKIIEDTFDVYNKVMKIIKNGVYCWKAHELYEDLLADMGYDIIHSLGHGIGLDAHELPLLSLPRNFKALSPKKKEWWNRVKNIKFEKNMVFTVEPGLYVKGVGGCRVENVVIMGEKNGEIITNSRLLEVTG